MQVDLTHTKKTSKLFEEFKPDCKCQIHVYIGSVPIPCMALRKGSSTVRQKGGQMLLKRFVPKWCKPHPWPDTYGRIPPLLPRFVSDSSAALLSLSVTYRR